jgi:hypothetical protein
MAYNSEFLQDEEVIRVTNSEFVAVRRDDLQGKIDIQIDVTTAEDSTAKAERLSFMLQTLGQTLPPEMLNLLLSQYFKLHKMPDLAKMIQEFEPQPDPYQEEVARLEIEKLKAEIFERNARATENETDVRLKESKANLDAAKARSTDSDTDLKDLDFLRRSSGDEFNEKLIEKSVKGNTKG